MPNEKQNAFTAWLEGRIAECALRQQALLADHRQDEANFEKIRSNVYDIFRTVFSVGTGTCKGDGIREFFLTKARQIPSGWEASYQAAAKHDDVKKMEIERIKLDTIQEIREKFSDIWEAPV